MRDKCILPFLITERLEFFQLTQADLPELEILLGDPEIMYAWEHGFTKIESQAWLNENLRRYSSDGYSYWAVRKKNDGSLIGVMGILKEVAEGKQYIGIGYILNKKYWGQGYAGEGTAALCQYAFRKLQLQTLTAQVRTNNFASQHIAEGLGMKAMAEDSIERNCNNAGTGSKKRFFTIITAGGRRRENAGSLSEERRSVCFI